MRAMKMDTKQTNWGEYGEFVRWQREQYLLAADAYKNEEYVRSREMLKRAYDQLLRVAAPTAKQTTVSYMKKKWLVTTAVIGGRVVVLAATLNARSRMGIYSGSRLLVNPETEMFYSSQDTSKIAGSKKNWVDMTHSYPYCLQDSCVKAVTEMQKVASLCDDFDEFVQQLGLKSKCCAICGSALSDEKSMQLGIGPVCAVKIYGSLARAEVIVERILNKREGQL